VTARPTASDVKARVDEARRNADLVMPGIWGALQGTAPRDRWDHAAARLKAAAEAIAKAQAALAAMEKLEPYCTACGEPILNLTAGWSHFRDGEWPELTVGRLTAGAPLELVEPGHEPDLDWREVPDAR
jgi:hypothetical protein